MPFARHTQTHVTPPLLRIIQHGSFWKEQWNPRETILEELTVEPLGVLEVQNQHLA